MVSKNNVSNVFKKTAAFLLYYLLFIVLSLPPLFLNPPLPAKFPAIYKIIIFNKIPNRLIRVSYFVIFSAKEKFKLLY